MSLAQKAASGLLWQFSSQSIQAVSSIVYLMAMGRMLDKEAFGVFALATVIVGMIAMFSEFGLGAALIQKKTLKPNDVSFTFYANLAISGLLYLLILATSPYIASFYDGKVSALLLNLLALQLVIKALSIVSQSLMIRDMAFKRLFVAQVIGYTTGSLIFGIGAAYYGFGHMALLIGLLSSTAITSILMFALNPHSLIPRFSHSDGKKILSFGYRLSLVRLVNQSANQLDKLIAGKHFSESVLGVYERFQKLIMLPESHIGRVSDSVAFSVFSKRQDSIDRLRSEYLSFLRIVCLVMVAISSVFFVFPEFVVGVFLGEKWVSESHILAMFSIIIFIQTFSRYGDTLVRSTDSLSESLPIKIVYMIAVLVGVTVGVDNGIEGVIMGVIVAKAVHSILMAWLTCRIINIEVGGFLQQMLPVVVAAAIFFGTAVVSRRLEVGAAPAVLLALSSSVLFCGALAMKTNLLLTSDDKQLLSRIVGSVAARSRS